MSRRDDAILRDPIVKSQYDALANLTGQIATAKSEQRRLIKILRLSGLSARFLGRVSDMSPQTILNISKADR